MKRLATLLGVLASFLGLLVFLISWEPGSALAKSRVFAIVAFVLCILLVWYGQVAKTR